MRGAVLASLVGACAAPVQRPAQTPVAAPITSPEVPRNHVAVRWSNIATVDNCFYFSGPTSGRDVVLGTLATLDVDGPVVRLGFPDASGTTFVGMVQEGGEVRLVHASQHSFSGPWSITERIEGRLAGGALRGRYRYEECESGSPCPGRCTITAELVTRWRGAP